MKLRKMGIVLLALMLASMVLVPLVSAESVTATNGYLTARATVVTNGANSALVNGAATWSSGTTGMDLYTYVYKNGVFISPTLQNHLAAVSSISVQKTYSVNSGDVVCAYSYAQANWGTTVQTGQACHTF